ncbi:macro domain-containing protein [Marinobacter orientalis]|uniref:Macro domain-containing protein n=1 Tax=Marinobacter orientalis TaxID=1928859 RepID=A0A7Y0R9C4_9GAMM|nr:macro domain-containing protein [Marinobacter orientalis]NMT62385.1 macro domain-containing protein [Marinobacter orientalis]TGX51088.1 macro domain-containing protein [Marinobacter orientalis]
MAQIELNGKIVECVRGDITHQDDIEAVVNAANAELMPGGGVAGALHDAAGPGLAEECRPMAPIRPGEAVISGGHNLPNRFVIHCLGPVYGVDEPSDYWLAECYRNALELADSKAIESIAFPAISAGAFGYPVEGAAEVALNTVKQVLPRLESVKRVRFVLFGAGDEQVFSSRLKSTIEQ